MNDTSKKLQAVGGYLSQHEPRLVREWIRRGRCADDWESIGLALVLNDPEYFDTVLDDLRDGGTLSAQGKSNPVRTLRTARNPLDTRLAGVMRQYGPLVAFYTGEVLITGRRGYSGRSIPAYIGSDASLKDDLEQLCPGQPFDAALVSCLEGWLAKKVWYEDTPLDSRWDVLVPWTALQVQRCLKGKVPVRKAVPSWRNREPKENPLEPLIRLHNKKQEILDWVQAEHPDLMKLSLNQVLHREARWHAALKRRNAVAEKTQQGSVVLAFPDGWTVQELKTSKQLAAEGEAMGHCVGGENYVSAVGGGKQQIFSLRDPEGVSHITLQVAEGRNVKTVLQAKGRGNNIPKKSGICQRLRALVGQQGWEAGTSDLRYCFPEREEDGHRGLRHNPAKGARALPALRNPLGIVDQVLTVGMDAGVFLKLSYCSDPKTASQPPACVLRRGCRPATPIAAQQLWLQPCEQGKWQVMGAVGRPAALRRNIQGQGAVPVPVVLELIDGRLSAQDQLEKLNRGAFSQDGVWVAGPLFTEVL